MEIGRYKWRTDGLDSWWNFFEEIIDNPMGRKLVNAACDEEEWLLNSQELDYTSFQEKKVKNAIEEMEIEWLGRSLPKST